MSLEIFKKDDKGLMNVRMAAVACKSTAQILKKYGAVTPKLPLTVPHILVHGFAGCGKTSRIEAAAEIMGCKESDNTFIRINPDCINNIETLIDILNTKLSWEGYLCNYGKTDHTNCPKHNHQIVDPVNPRTPVKQQIVFLDEVHVLPKEVQEKLGLIILDFRYQLVSKSGYKTHYFPKFTFCGATTKPGDLIKPLRTRFGIKIAVTTYNDSEMMEIANTMLSQRGLNVSEDAKKIICNISQGIPRELENHITGLFNCWMYLLSTGQYTNKCVITREVAQNYIKVQRFLEDGLSSSQISVLKYLYNFKQGIGITRVCNATGIDLQRFNDELEPRLVERGHIVAGGRGRQITESGRKYLEDILEHNPEFK